MIDSSRTWLLLRSLRRGSRTPPEEIRRRQAHLLRDAIAHARERIPLYRRVWAGLDGVADLEHLPVITAAQVREALATGELPAEGARPLGVFHTSGSTGEPLGIPRGAVEQRLWRATGLRAWFEHGYRWRHSTVHFDSHPGPSHPLQGLGVSRTTWIAPGLEMAGQIDRLAAAEADVVAATPTVLRRLCRALAGAGRRVRRPHTVFSQGEVLDQGTADLVERTLGTVPVDLYGLTEAGYVGWQCEQRGHLHVNAEACLVEVLRDGRPAAPGELGSVVVTNLRGRTAPMIRFDTGDLARAVEGPCPCGRTLPLIGRLAGRAAEAMTAAGGATVTTRTVLDDLAPVAAPDEFQLHAVPGGRFELRLAPGVDHGEQVAARLAVVLGGAEVTLAPGHVPPAPGSVKTRTVV